METHDINGVNVRIDKMNNRLRILDYENLSENIISEVIRFAKEKDLGKIISNCPVNDLKVFEENGFSNEGTIRNFYRGKDASCPSFFLKPGRSVSRHPKREDTIIRMALEKKRTYKPRKTGLEIRTATQEDIPAMIDIFKTVFESYPTPVHEENYLERVMDSRIYFKAAFDGGKLISIASADMDKKNLNAEITDCATYPKYRGHGLLSKLISAIENDIRKMGFISAYSLSRAINPGINISLSKLSYDYTGRLVNNCDICGGFEDMNIWCKKL
jgi:putative beta-lysine N-acetyltransferase